MTAHSRVLVWRIPWTGEPGGLQFIGSHRVGHDRSDLAHTQSSQNSDWHIHAHLILLRFIVLHRHCIFFFYKLKVCVNPAYSKFFSAIFLDAFA